MRKRLTEAMNRLFVKGDRLRVGPIAGILIAGGLIAWLWVTGHVALMILLVVIATPVVVATRVRLNKQTSRQEKIEAARNVVGPGRTTRPRRLGPWIDAAGGERVVVEGRKHWVSTWPWWLLLCVSPLILVAGIVGAAISPRGGVIIFLTGLATTLLLAAVAGWHVFRWWYDWRAVTTWKVVEVENILDPQAPSIPSKVILNVWAGQPTLSRVLEAIFGIEPFYSVHMDSAPQDEPKQVKHMNFVTQNMWDEIHRLMPHNGNAPKTDNKRK